MNKVAVCPSCGCKYRVPKEFKSRKISCKQCGTNFSLTLQNEGQQIDQDKTAQPLQEQIEEIAPDDSYLLMGKLAVKYKFATIEQIEQALIHKKQKRQAGQDLLLGKILVSQGILSQSQLVFLHSVQKLIETRASDNRFALIAVKNEFVTQKQIDLALLEQKRIFKASKTVHPLEDILVESGVLKAEQRDAILTRQKSMHKDAVDEKNKTKETGIKQPAEHDAQFELDVSKDMLSAFILPKGPLPDSVTVESIKNFLQNKEIKFGLVDDNQIAAYLESADNYKKPWEIAQGQPPEAGQDAKIKYFFETDPLNMGAVRQGDTIDFTDMGNIPAVKKGELVAEKTPAQEGSPGMDVYGRPIPAPKPNDKKLRYGQGTIVSEDGLKAFAATDGLFEISLLGRVYVLPRHEISGDVGLKTGHVDFDGDIEVAGSIKSRCRVKGHRVTAGEILKANVETTGDIVTPGGIIGATIHSGGNVRAIFIREADIKAFGDVIVKKGIRDSNIETSGACIIREGTILSSTIIAKKGIWAAQIGSEISKPCKLAVGSDARVSSELEKLAALIAARNEELNNFKRLKKELNQKSKDAENKIGELAQLQDRAMVEQRNIQADIEKLKAAKDSIQLATAETALRELEAEVQEMEKNMENLFDLQDQISGKITAIDQSVKALETDVLELEDKITEITEWSSNGSEIPEIRVKDDIFSDTIIDGISSSMSLKRKLKNVLIKEHSVKSGDHTAKYELKISPLS